ncbi:MAG: hypothetical protein WKG07_01265 [Hymenobacter sp.]
MMPYLARCTSRSSRWKDTPIERAMDGEEGLALVEAGKAGHRAARHHDAQKERARHAPRHPELIPSCKVPTWCC